MTIRQLIGYKISRIVRDDSIMYEFLLGDFDLSIYKNFKEVYVSQYEEYDIFVYNIHSDVLLYKYGIEKLYR